MDDIVSIIDLEPKLSAILSVARYIKTEPTFGFVGGNH